MSSTTTGTTSWSLRIPIAGHSPRFRLSLSPPQPARKLETWEVERWRQLPLPLEGCSMREVQRALGVVQSMVPAVAADLEPCSMSGHGPPVVKVTRDDPDLDSIWDTVLAPLIVGLVAHEIVAARQEWDCPSPAAESCLDCDGRGGHYNDDHSDDEGVPAWEPCDVCHGSCLSWAP